MRASRNLSSHPRRLFNDVRQVANSHSGLACQFHARLRALTAFFGDHDRGVGRALYLVENAAHPGCRFARLARQEPHLAGNYGKAKTFLTGPRRFDAGIQRQQPGLIRDLFDRVDDLTDLLSSL